MQMAEQSWSGGLGTSCGPISIDCARLPAMPHAGVLAACPYNHAEFSAEQSACMQLVILSGQMFCLTLCAGFCIIFSTQCSPTAYGCHMMIAVHVL